MERIYEKHFLAIEQEATARFPLIREQCHKLREQKQTITQEIDRIDAALDEARFRRARLAGSRAQYNETRAQALTRELLGETSDTDEQSQLGLAAQSDVGLETAVNILTKQRMELVRSRQINESQLQDLEREAYASLMRVAAAQYESMREATLNAWAKVTALSRLAKSGPTSDYERWGKICLPSVTLDKQFRTSPSASSLAALTDDSSGQVQMVFSNQAKRDLMMQDEPEQQQPPLPDSAPACNQHMTEQTEQSTAQEAV